MSLKGKTALVTGAGRGIGRAICLRLASMGADIIINYAGNDKEAQITRELCEQAGQAGVRAMTYKADVGDFAQCEEMLKAAESALDAPAILINNAGITRDSLMLRMTPEDFDAVLAVNLRGAFHCTKLVSRQMIRRREGRIINIASVVGLTGNAGQLNYAASKAGLIGMTKSAARELAGRGITVNAIAPGFIETDMTAVLPQSARQALLAQIPLSRPGRGEEVAAAAAFLCGEDAAYITGQVINVDGGMVMS